MGVHPPMVGLTGLVINDAIVLINFINQRIKDGLPLKQALLTAGHQRMRPIMMTTFTTIAGLLPMAIGIPDFSIAWSPFATAFIAGLTVSTSMTLLIIPVLFEILEKFRRNKFFKRFHNT
jgi:HAE1 family hydrophobic/amphiphilic exporter-1